MADRWNIAQLRNRTAQRWTPQSGVEASQGNPFQSVPSLRNTAQVPLDPGVNLAGWLNPYSQTMYQVGPLSTTIAQQIAPPNLRRVYLFIQNQGPGNLFVNFGNTATAPVALGAPANCLQLITTQVYEQVGGGTVDQNGFPRPACFVSPDYISAITDTATTTALVSEGVFLLSRFAQFFSRA